MTHDFSSKKILFVITKSNWGGAQSYVFTLASHLHEQGADVAVALGGTGRPGSDTGMLAARLAHAGIRTLVVPSFMRDISVVREWRSFREVLALIRKERPDILHLNSSKAGGIGALAGRLAGVKRVVFTVHGWPHREPRFFLWRIAVWKASWLTVFLSHAVVVISELDRRIAPALFLRRKIHLIHNGVAAFPLKTREEARRFLAPTIPELVTCTDWILMNSELTKNKAVDNAIRAFAGVSTNMDNAALVVVSDGEEHERLTRLIESYGLQKRAFLLGFVPDAKQYLAAADIFLMPSRKEGFPLALLEAGHAALPAIASNVGGIPEIIEHEKTGLLVRPNDIDALADSLTRLLKDPDEAKRFGIALQKTVREKFSEEDMLTQTVALYTKT